MSLPLFSTRLALAALALSALFMAADGRAQAPVGVVPLTPFERGLIVATLAPQAPEPMAMLPDSELVSVLLQEAQAKSSGRFDPSAVDREWALEPVRRDLATEFEAVRASNTLAAWLAGLEPPHEGYRSLMLAQVRYRAMADAGGWAQVKASTPLHEGVTAPTVAQLRARLAAEGYIQAASETPDLFDPTLAASLSAFQATHGLTADGVLGPTTLRALNVTAAQRLDQIDANLERWRWLPRRMPPTRVEVDIGAQRASLFEAGVETLGMRAIVGRAATRTPMFAARLQWIVFNPPWNVPTSIARGEILPKAARDPGYLARNRYSWVDGGLQQRPGPGNALGRVKFDFESPFGVYLHDTSSPSLFATEQRTLSHGCMRLEKPRELAERLLAAQAWTRPQIDAAIEAGATRRLTLTEPAPLFVVYRTAFVDGDGRLNFRADVYGWDAKLAAALRRASA